MAGGSMLDLNASLSASASATSGNKADSFGDVYYNAQKPTPPWMWLALAGLALVAFALWKK